jgi:hypothetical protein
LRHNPYVGTFFNVKHNVDNTETSSSELLAESKNNPIVGVFRHSPSVISKSLGLKVGVMYNPAPSAPVVSRLQQPNSQEAPTLFRRNFVTALKQIPVKRFTASSIGSRSSASSAVDDNANSIMEMPTLEQHPIPPDDAPLCAICLDPYADGDEILTLACSHCFHSDCVSRWFYQDCLNSNDMSSTFSCPQCRQDHVALSESRSNQSSSDNTACIAAQSFLSVGQNLLRDGGYDFLSDCTSEAPLSAPKPADKVAVSAPKHIDNSVINNKDDNINIVVDTNILSEGTQSVEEVVEEEGDKWSTYSDCGFPLNSNPSPSQLQNVSISVSLSSHGSAIKLSPRRK